MSIRRAVPDVKSRRLDESRKFYVDFLGFKVGMDMDFIMTFVSPSNPTAQISVIHDDAESKLHPDVTVEVTNVDDV
jgi:catechol 2,3-dioxygenase-like lactoylglutathione lyase family enzyme